MRVTLSDSQLAISTILQKIISATKVILETVLVVISN
jgi:hypothetical protein